MCALDTVCFQLPYMHYAETIPMTLFMLCVLAWQCYVNDGSENMLQCILILKIPCFYVTLIALIFFSFRVIVRIMRLVL